MAFSLLKQHLRAEYGVDIELYSVYRTKEDQQWVYDYYGNLEGWSESKIRFVGSTKIAHEIIMDSGLCLEEYLEIRDSK